MQSQSPTSHMQSAPSSAAPAQPAQPSAPWSWFDKLCLVFLIIVAALFGIMQLPVPK